MNARSIHYEVGCPCGSDPTWHRDWHRPESIGVAAMIGSLFIGVSRREDGTVLVRIDGYELTLSRDGADALGRMLMAPVPETGWIHARGEITGGG